MIKITIKLRETSTLNLEQIFYEELKNAIKTKEIRTLKMLIETSLNVYRLFSKRLLIIITIAHKRFEIVKLLIIEYNVILERYFIYIVIKKRKS